MPNSRENNCLLCQLIWSFLKNGHFDVRFSISFKGVNGNSVRSARLCCRIFRGPSFRSRRPFSPGLQINQRRKFINYSVTCSATICLFSHHFLFPPHDSFLLENYIFYLWKILVPWLKQEKCICCFFLSFFLFARFSNWIRSHCKFSRVKDCTPPTPHPKPALQQKYIRDVSEKIYFSSCKFSQCV